MNQLLTNNGGFEGEVKVTPITYNNTQATGKISYSCFNILLSKCTGIPYDCGGSFCGYYHYTICVADDETGGGGDNGTVVGSGSTAGSGNPNGGGSNPITTPNGGSTSTASNPCATLNKINTMNSSITAAGYCGRFIPVNPGGTIPAYAKVLFLTSLDWA